MTVDDTLYLDYSDCYFGGVRPWFSCPDCSQRVAVLYAPSFTCRKCLNLAYESQRPNPVLRSMKNVVKLEHYYYPWELEKAIAKWVEHYNHERYHESLDNVTSADVYEGRRNDILDQRAVVKSRTMNQRKGYNLRLAG